MQQSLWSTDRSLRDELVSSIITEQFPALAPALVTGRSEGFDNQVFEINERWIFRFPKRTDVEPLLTRELELLRRLAPSLDVSVPRYDFVGERGPFPYIFAGYPRLSGTPAIELSLGLIDAIGLAATLASFLSVVHAFTLAEARALGVHEGSPDSRVLAAEALVELETLRSVIDAGLASCCRSHLENGLRARTACPPQSRLLHGDFSAEHILLSSDGKNVEGVIDWTDAEIGDPAFDFGYLWAWQGEPFVREVLRHYRGQVDDGFLVRACVYGVCSAIADLSYGSAAGVEKNRRIGLAALARAFLQNS